MTDPSGPSRDDDEERLGDDAPSPAIADPAPRWLIDLHSNLFVA